MYVIINPCPCQRQCPCIREVIIIHIWAGVHQRVVKVTSVVYAGVLVVFKEFGLSGLDVFIVDFVFVDTVITVRGLTRGRMLITELVTA